MGLFLKKHKAAIISVVVIMAIVTGIITYGVLNRFEYNKEGTVGNTTGNLYNKGTFCEYKGYVYFSNPDDDGELYRMKKNGDKCEKLFEDTASYINIANDYIYYVRFNRTKTDEIIRGNLYGIYRMKIGEFEPEELYRGMVTSMVLCGNYLYFQAYDDSDKEILKLKKVKIDGKELKTISKADYIPLAVKGTEIYFTEVENNHNLKRINTENDVIETVSEGNFYEPVWVDNYIYYIDADNGMKLTRMGMNSANKQVLTDDYVINYNIDPKTGVIFYQVENGTEDHRLCRMDMDGNGSLTIMEGDCNEISVAGQYTYFKKIEKSVDDTQLYRVETNGLSLSRVDFTAIKK